MSADAPAAGSLKDLRAALLADTDRQGDDWCREWSAAASAWVADLFGSVVGPGKAVALVAVGGFGRGALAPGSDLDLVLVHDRRRDIASLADRLWYPIWDAGVSLDHSVRTLKEARTAMEADVKVALGLLDARLVAGDPGLFDELGDLVRSRWAARSERWLAAIDELRRERHDRFGDLAFLLEPDLKEARGGLRDLEQMHSVARAVPSLGDRLGGRPLGLATRCLSAVRVELQRNGPSTSNVLLLQDQDAVAEALGHADADALMASVADAARTIAWISDDWWRRATAPSGSRRSDGETPLEPGVVVRNGEIAVARRADPALDPSLALRVAAASAERDLPVSRAALERLAARTVVPPDEVWAPGVLQAFVRLLGAGRTAIAAIEALDHAGIWMRYLPEWEPVRNRPQRNAYHRYTVDRHLLEAVANASALQARVSRPDLLLLGALLHDIGKGRGGDHTAIGMEVVPALAARMGLSAEDSDVLVSLVEHHLLLADAATRRDLDDPATAVMVAEAVGQRDTLDLLAALTEADSAATGPAAWGQWKAGLVGRLVDQAGAALEGRPPPDTRRAALSESERQVLASGELSVLVSDDDPGRVAVAAVDRPGLLSVVAGVLTLSGVSVRSATTVSDDESGMALLRFEVSAAFDRLPDWNRFRTSLESALAGEMDVDAQLEERDARYSRYAPRITAYTPEVRVLFHPSPDATIVEVRAPDRGPVLHRVTQVLTDSGLSITCALVSTLGAEAIDVFYVRPPIGTADRESAVRDAVVAALA